MGPNSSKFVHRPNRDGTFDAICPQCFITVATKLREEDLKSPEHDHHCDPKLLERYTKSKKDKSDA